MSIEEIVKRQRDYFGTGATLPVEVRLGALERLKKAIHEHEHELLRALESDLGKSEFEGYMTELAMVYEELNYMLRHTRQLSRPRRVRTAPTQRPSRSVIYSEPYGVALIMSPWNYPVCLTLTPLAGAIAAGNCVVIKPSAYSPSTSETIARLIGDCFAPEYVSVVTGGREQNTELLKQRFDYVFFTGSVEVGKTVMRAASNYLTPVTLELGGKSPCIVDATANIDIAARRIINGKLYNSGQTCISPDYVLVQKQAQAELCERMQSYIKRFLGSDPLKCAEYPHIVNKKHFDRLLSLIEKDKVICGGRSDEETLKIEPTLLRGECRAMNEEIFGPLLPIIEYDTLSDAADFIKKYEKPLALYLFSNDKESRRQITESVSFGGGCINDTVVHYATNSLPFGGVGMSGMGSYHAEASFNTFSHKKGVLITSDRFDLSAKYHPFSAWWQRVMRSIFGR